MTPHIGYVLKRFPRILVPELNMGQLSWLMRAKFLIDARGLNKIQGQPFKVTEICAAVDALLERGAAADQRRERAINE